jgi:hypothetical protein
MKLEIAPYIGPLPLRLGSTESEISELIGPPLSKRKNHLGEPAHNHGFCAIGYDKNSNKANYFGFLRSTEISYKSVAMFDNPDAFKFMVVEDGEPFEFVGFILLLNLGVSLSGFHDNDESQLAVNMFERGRFEKFRSQFKPFKFQ